MDVFSHFCTMGLKCAVTEPFENYLIGLNENNHQLHPDSSANRPLE